MLKITGNLTINNMVHFGTSLRCQKLKTFVFYNKKLLG